MDKKIDDTLSRIASVMLEHFKEAMKKPNTVPFSYIKEGTKFKFPKSDEILTKTSKCWYKDKNGKHWRTGSFTLVQIVN